MVNLFKSGDPYDTGNYRGLVINLCLGKLFNTVINNRLDRIFLSDGNKICKEHIGLKKRARTSDHIFVMNALLQKYSKAKKKLYMCLLILRKLKILENGVRGNMFKVIENMYIGGKSCIKTDGYLPRDIECESGVKQGDVLSPNLFNTFVNDLPKCFVSGDGPPVIGKKHLNCLMYADDLVVLSLSLDDLQIQLNNLKEYCQEWGLEVNR